MRVGLTVLGAQKCGTSTLFNILARHPKMTPCRVKEPHFFSTTPDWSAHLPEYEALFDAKPGTIAFEASTSYTFFPLRNLEIWRDLHAYNPEMRFIYVVRNPLDRIVSHYAHSLRKGRKLKPLDQAVREDRAYIDISRYHTQISPFIETFGGERVLVLDFDDLTKERIQTMDRVARFLDVDPEPFTGAEKVHSNPSVARRKKHHRLANPGPVLSAVRRYLPPVWKILKAATSGAIDEKPVLALETQRLIIRMLELEIRETEKLLGKDLSRWRSVSED